MRRMTMTRRVWHQPVNEEDEEEEEEEEDDEEDDNDKEGMTPASQVSTHRGLVTAARSTLFQAGQKMSRKFSKFLFIFLGRNQTCFE